MKNNNIVQKSFYVNKDLYNHFVSDCKAKGLIKTIIISNLIKEYLDRVKEQSYYKKQILEESYKKIYLIKL